MSKSIIALIIFGVITFVVVIAGCSVFPSTTTVSATSKSGNLDNPTVKVQQEFKWSR